MPIRTDDGPAYSFGPFRLLATQRLLLEGDEPVQLGSRAFDILAALIGRQGELVGKRELMATVWPDTVVVEANLAVHVTALRRALGDGRTGRRYIVTIPGRGYRFVADVTADGSSPTRAAHVPTAARPNNLPSKLTHLIGRDEVVASLVAEMLECRLITIVGSPGIGKTAVALEVAGQLASEYADGVWLVDLAPIGDARLVPTTLASVLKLEVRSDNPLPSLIAAVNDRHMLLVLDNCEHVIEAVAAMVAGILKGSRRVQVLAASRESLRVEGERVRRLSPLESPPAVSEISALEALGFPAVQLLVERIAAGQNEFGLNDANAMCAGDICRKLDGIPLAIEFAAARVEAFGVCGVAARLDDRLRLLTGGRRATPPRHQTIEAALDWSYHLLSPQEQTVFRRLAIFAGGFTLGAARNVAGELAPVENEITDHVLELVAKSLVVPYAPGAEPRFRLLEVTRAYALAKLTESGEKGALDRRHAEYMRALLESSPYDPSYAAGWPRELAVEIDNVRAAMNWAFSPEGELSVGAALAAASTSLWLGMSLLTECRSWMMKAVPFMDAGGLDMRRQMLVQAALVSCVIFTDGMTGEDYVPWAKAVALADTLKDPAYQHHLLVVLWACQIRVPDLREALSLACQCDRIAAHVADLGTTALTEWMLGVTKHHLGQHDEAKIHLQRVIENEAAAASRTPAARHGYNVRVDALGVLANLLWIRGFPDQALLTGAMSVEAARKCDYALPLCVALAWNGFNMYLAEAELTETESCAGELVGHAQRHSITSYHGLGLCLLGTCLARRGDHSVARQSLADGLELLSRSRYGVFHPIFGGELAKAMSASGHVDAGLATIAAIEREAHDPEHWCMPEFLRNKGELLLLKSDEDSSAAAEQQFLRSIESAKKQGALSWELRAATSMARLRRRQGRNREAVELLASVYGRFSEGFQTADLVVAKHLLDDLV
jgi:predicted ATPase/DNA-binding winged helix-turn-helix (wHTH) protein